MDITEVMRMEGLRWILLNWCRSSRLDSCTLNFIRGIATHLWFLYTSASWRTVLTWEFSLNVLTSSCPVVVFCWNSCTYLQTFSPSGRGTVIVFEPKWLLKFLMVTPLMTGLDTGWVGKICIFQLMSPLISEVVLDRLTVTMDHY